MGLGNVIEQKKKEIANIGSKMMTGKTIEERVKEIFVKASDKNEAVDRRRAARTQRL